MKITQIISETTAGCVATVAMPMGETQKRPKVSGLEPADKVMFGKSKKKGPYGNSLSEGKMKDLSIDLRASKDGLSDIDFKNKYGKTKQEMRKLMQDARKEQKVTEAELSEQDLIVVPGQGRKMKTGFVPHGASRLDHEVEMARSDLFSAAQNAQKVYSMIKNMSEEEGLEGWVQEKIIKANDYLNTIREYLEGKQAQGVAEGSSTNAEVTKRAKAAAQKAGKTFNTDVEYRLWYAITTQANAATRKADKKQGMAEGVAETMTMDDAMKVLRHYGAGHFKTTSNELHFYKNGQPFNLDLIWNDDATRSVSISQLNSATRQLKGQDMAEEVDTGQYDARKSNAKGATTPEQEKEFRKKVQAYGKELEQRQKEKVKGVAEGTEQRWRVTVGNKSGTLSHTKTFTGTKEQAIKQAVTRFATTKNPVVTAELVKQDMAEGAETPEKELERLKLRQDAEHGRASLKRQSDTQARIRELEKQIKGQQDVAEAGPYGSRNPDLMTPQNYDRYQQDQMDYNKRAFKRDELEQELGNEEEYYRQQQQRDAGTWYIRINGKVLKDKQGNPYTFRGKAAANKAAVTMMQKPFNAGKKFMLTTNLADT